MSTTEISLNTVRKYISFLEKEGDLSSHLESFTKMPSFAKWVQIFCNNPAKEPTLEEKQEIKDEKNKASLGWYLSVDGFIESAKELAKTISSSENQEITQFELFKLVFQLRKEMKMIGERATRSAINYSQEESAADAWFSSPHFP